MVQHALDRLFISVTRKNLHTVITNEIGPLETLDGFLSRPNRPCIFARGVDRVLIIASDTTIGVAIPPLIFALCAKAHVTVKDRDDHLVSAFARTLIEQDPIFATALHVQPWRDHEDPALQTAVAEADVVVAFGRDETMRAIRAQCKPGARFLPFGHRTSIGYFPREALADQAQTYRHACAAARDALLYDGEGCLSIHAIFVENGAPITPYAFTALFTQACDEIAQRFPYAHQEVIPSIAAYRDRALFRSAQGSGAVYGADDTRAHLVVLDPPHDEPPPLLPRTVGLYSIDGPNDMLAYVREHSLPLEAVGTPPHPRSDLLEAFVATGVSRITTLGRLQDPPLTGNHGGYGRITPFVRFIYRDGEHA